MCKESAVMGSVLRTETRSRAPELAQMRLSSGWQRPSMSSFRRIRTPLDTRCTLYLCVHRHGQAWIPISLPPHRSSWA